MIPMNVWGQGALFAFSGLEGETRFDSQLVGSLLGDHAGIRFPGAHPFSLYVDTTGIPRLEWEIVSSDLIRGKALVGNEWRRICFAFRSNATVVGVCPAGRLRLVFDSGKAEEGVSLCTVTDGGDDWFCLSAEGETACGPEATVGLIEQRAAYWERFRQASLREDVGKAYLHALSVMKSQVYSPEGIFRHRWTTPERYPHKKLWLWDSCFHSLGNHLLGEELAMDSILSLLDSQQEDGMIPHMSSPKGHSRITQPPLIAWSVEKIVERTGDAGFAAQCWDRLEKYLRWDMDHRRSENGLFYWHINRDEAHNRCDESGMDNCSRFDDVEEMECIDFSCFMKREADAMSHLAELLSKPEDAERWAETSRSLSRLINERLWDEETRMYYDRVVKTGKLHRFPSICSFLPLFAGVCSQGQKEALLAWLDDPQAFKTPFSIPTIPVSHPTFGTDLWCGPVWLNYVYLVAEGLARYGEQTLADDIIRSTVLEVSRVYGNDGVFYEYYDSQRRISPHRFLRKGPPVIPYLCTGKITQDIRDYGWTATIFAALVYEHPELFSPDA